MRNIYYIKEHEKRMRRSSHIDKYVLNYRVIIQIRSDQVRYWTLVTTELESSLDLV